MTTEALPVPFGRRGGRRGWHLPGFLPILVAFAAWTAWAVFADPFAALGAAARQGWAASDETLFLAVISAVGVMGMVLFAVAVGAYVLAMRPPRHTR